MIEITQKHWNTAAQELGAGSIGAEIANRANEIAEAEAAKSVHPDSIEADRYITAEQAKALGAGNAEWRSYSKTAKWNVCTDYNCEYATGFEYRATQAKPTEPHAELKALYQKHVDEGTVGNYVWELKTIVNPDVWQTLTGIKPSWTDTTQYRCIPKANLVTLDGELMSRELAIIKYEQCKDTYGVWFKTLTGIWVASFNSSFTTNSAYGEYQLRAKKQVHWKDMPVGIAVDIDGLDYSCHYQGIGFSGGAAIRKPIGEARHVSVFYSPLSNMKISTSDQQPWLNWRGGNCPVPNDGVIVEVTLRNGCNSKGSYLNWSHDNHNRQADIIEYRVVGLVAGWELV